MYWTREEITLPGHISVDRRSKIISEFAEMNPHGTIVICGGESLMNPERYFPITKQCRELGLKCFSVINGTIVINDENAEKMILEGPSEITISLNSYIPSVHDQTRGVEGSFDLATNAIRLLLGAREKLNKTTPIYAMAIICEQNYRNLDRFYDFILNDLKADKLKINFLQPTFAPLKNEQGIDRDDTFYKENIIKDYNGLIEILKKCDQKYTLNLNSAWLDVVRMYHKNVLENDDGYKGWAGKGTEKPICNSYERNIMVDLFGVARLCFSTKFPGTKINKYGDLRKFWHDNNSLRQRMSSCMQYCGISHSVRKISATNK